VICRPQRLAFKEKREEENAAVVDEPTLEKKNVGEEDSTSVKDLK
jgi:hypothetical protein